MKFKCNICPRDCNKIRNNMQGYGFCKMPYLPMISNYSLHKWEEPCISGVNGSGTIFFTGCNLQCVFCQNYIISHKNVGKIISIDELTKIMYELIEKGAHNINFVNPTHYVHIIKQILQDNKFDVPIIYNSSGYESVDTLKELNGLIDVYLPDLKYYNNEIALKYSNAANYFDIATKAILEMYNQTGKCEFNKNGIIQRGTIVRHLILSNNINNTINILEWCKENLSQDILISIMGQYIPMGQIDDYPELKRRVNKIEYNRVIKFIYDNEINNGYIQDLSSAKKDFIPKWFETSEEKI